MMAPKICSVGLEFIILIREVDLGNGVFGNVQHHVSIFNDQSVFLKEIFSSIKGDEVLHTAHSKNFGEFSEKFPDDALKIGMWLLKIGAKIPWMDERCVEMG
jgi:hypothetical protein